MSPHFLMSLEEFAEIHRCGFNVEFDPVVMPLMYLLKAGKAYHMSILEHDIQKIGLSIFEADVLLILKSSFNEKQLTPKQVGERLVISSGGLTKVLNQLERKGLITRLIDEHDKRSKPIKLTPPGEQKAIDALLQLQSTTDGWVHGRLSDEKIIALSNLLSELVPLPKESRQPV